MQFSKANSQISDEDGDASWVIVKKQRINILIPPAPTANTHFTPLSVKADNGSPTARSLPVVSTNLGIRRMRFLNFERRIKKLGGIRKWLLSNGFHTFVPVFERGDLSLHQLFHVSMESLRKKGVMPVGPRRKLIHAIEKLSLPLL